MLNNKLIQYKENVFVKIINFFRKFFAKGQKKIDENALTENNIQESNFIKSIHIEENEEEKRLKKLQLLYDEGQIDEDDLTEEEIEKLVALYEKETEELNADTLRRKKHIQEMLKELKTS